MGLSYSVPSTLYHGAGVDLAREGRGDWTTASAEHKPIAGVWRQSSP